MNTLTETAKVNHIIHASGRTENEDRRELSYTIIECSIRDGVVVSYDAYNCPSCHQAL